MVHPELHAALRPYLLRGERVLWAGRPKRGIVLRTIDLFLIPFSLVWAAGVFSVGVQARPFEDGPFAIGMSLLFVAAAVHVTVGRFAHDAWIRSRLVYALTDRRVIMLRTGWMARLRSLELRHLPMLDLKERSGGRGAILFDSPPANGWWAGNAPFEWSAAVSATPQFVDVDEVRTVYELIARECERIRREALAAVPADRAFIG